MDTASFTLRDFFGNETITDAALENLHVENNLREVADDMHKEVPEGKGRALVNAIARHLDDLLGIEVSDILLRAWKKYENLGRYNDPLRYPPDQLFLVPLTEHTISSKHKPALEIAAGKLFKKTIPFDIALELELTGFMLEIQGGKIITILTGECRGKGTVSCMGTLLLNRESEEIRLPGSIALGDGIPIVTE